MNVTFKMRAPLTKKKCILDKVLPLLTTKMFWLQFWRALNSPAHGPTHPTAACGKLYEPRECILLTIPMGQFSEA